MPSEAVACRHCGKRFVPHPDKPGYRDECPNCIYAKLVESCQPSTQIKRDRKQAEISKATTNYLKAVGRTQKAKRKAEELGITIQEYLSRLRAIIEQN